MKLSHPASMQLLRSNSLKRTVAARMGIFFVSGLERIMRVACRPSIPGIMMFMRIRWDFSLRAFSTPYLPLLAVMTVSPIDSIWRVRRNCKVELSSTKSTFFILTPLFALLIWVPTERLSQTFCLPRFLKLQPLA